jgi:predicted nucleic acid-binding protein
VKVLLDTNILLRLCATQAPEHADVVRAVAALLVRGDEPMIAAQVLIELWVVATRPVAVNGFGWTVAQTHAAILGFRAQFALLEDTPAVLTHWLALVVANGVEGKRAHDARLAATMLAHGVTTVLTLNPKDFAGFHGIAVLHPRDL